MEVASGNVMMDIFLNTFCLRLLNSTPTEQWSSKQRCMSSASLTLLRAVVLRLTVDRNCHPGVVISSQPIGARANKYQQSCLTWGWMPIVAFCVEDKSQMLVGVSGCFLSSVKGVIVLPAATFHLKRQRMSQTRSLRLTRFHNNVLNQKNTSSKTYTKAPNTLVSHEVKSSEVKFLRRFTERAWQGCILEQTSRQK